MHTPARTDLPCPTDLATAQPLAPFNEQRLALWNPTVSRLAPVLNRSFTTSLAVRAIAVLLGQRLEESAESGHQMAPAESEALLGAIVTLTSDLNREACRMADFLEQACSAAEGAASAS